MILSTRKAIHYVIFKDFIVQLLYSSKDDNWFKISIILLCAMELFSIKLPLIKKNDPLLQIIIKTIKDQGKSLIEGDIIVIAEKVIATSQGRVIALSEIKNV